MSESTSECTICYCPIQGASVKCVNTQCVLVMCELCAIRYIDIVSRDGSRLCCPCDADYDEVSFFLLPEEHKIKYRKWLINYFYNTQGDEIRKFESKNVAIAKLREERLQFYKENMPKGILKIAELAFKGRLNRIPQSQGEAKSSQYIRKCINLFCNGLLNTELTCSKCDTVFCKECEEQKGVNHVCKKEVIDNLNFLKTLTSCPKCNTKIEKAEGCMAMTCAVCFTNFWYNTGLVGENGNHGKSKRVHVKDEYNISEEYNADILTEFGNDGLTFIRNLETDYRKGSGVTKTRLIRDASFFKSSGGGDVEYPVEFSRLYSRFTRHGFSISLIGKKLVAIEKELREKTENWNTHILSVMNNNSQTIIMSKVLVSKNKVLIIEEIERFSSIQNATKKTHLDQTEILKALEGMNNGIVKKVWHFEYV